MIEPTVIAAIVLWFAFYLVNYAEITKPVRDALSPTMPRWLNGAISCSLCFSWWILLTFSLFVGFSYLLFTCPPTTLFIDLLYLRLKPTT